MPVIVMRASCLLPSAMKTNMPPKPDGRHSRQDQRSRRLGTGQLGAAGEEDADHGHDDAEDLDGGGDLASSRDTATGTSTDRATRGDTMPIGPDRQRPVERQHGDHAHDARGDGPGPVAGVGRPRPAHRGDPCQQHEARPPGRARRPPGEAAAGRRLPRGSPPCPTSGRTARRAGRPCTHPRATSGRARPARHRLPRARGAIACSGADITPGADAFARALEQVKDVTVRP